MFGDIARAQRLRAKAATVTEHITVTREEFIKLMVASGKSMKEAELQAKISSIMGGECLIGTTFVSIERRKDGPT